MVCDTYTSGIPYSVPSRAGYMALNLGETRNQKKLFISPLPVLHSPVWLIDRAIGVYVVNLYIIDLVPV